MIPFSWIEKYPNDHECFLKRIADFLLDSHKWWEETSDGIIFKSVDSLPGDSSLILHHYRSSTLKEEEQYLQRYSHLALSCST